MREVSREWLEFLREQYPKGSRVRLTKMGNDPHPIPPGSMGTLKYIDDVGQFHVKWDNGRGLALIIGEDQFQILPPEPQTIKFYMPLTAQLYAYDDWGDLEEYGNDLDGSELRDYQSCIHEALLENQMPEEKNRGLMHWYDKPDGVNTKVQSVMLDVESRDGQLWGVAECKVNGTLLPEEKEALAEYISGQASDGWGEGFEQRAIKLNDGELYVSLWNSSNWSIQTEEERFSPDSLTRLPDLCWSVLPSEGTLICIKRGESGYYDELLAGLEKQGLSLPTADEWAYLCGGGCRTLFPWGDGMDYSMHLHHFESPEDEDKPFDMEEPNFFGVSIAYDPYMREVVKAEQFTTCGGDGGRSICGGLGIFLGFLPCSPHYKPEVQEDKELNGDYDFYRPIIRVEAI